MAKKRIIAYYMDEAEQAAALQKMTSVEATESFAIGDVEEADIAGLESAGLVVRPAEAPPPTDRRAETQVRSAGIAALGLETAAPEALAPDTFPASEDYYAVRLRGPLLESWRQQLASVGVTLTESLDSGTFKARLSFAEVQAVGALPFVESVRWITPSHSLPVLATQSAPAAPGTQPEAGLRMLAFDARLHRPEDMVTVLQWLRGRNVAVAGTSARKIRFYALENSDVLASLATLPEVDTVAEYVPPTLCNDAARRLIGLDAPAGNNPATYLKQDGSGQIVGVADTGIDNTHPDFQGRIVAAIGKGRTTTDDPNGHGTHVAGSVLADGSASNGQFRGVAPKAELFFQSLLDANGNLGGLPLDLNDLFNEAYQAGVRIHNNSWGSMTPSSYTLSSEEVDEFIRAHPDMLIVIAAGNAGTGVNLRKADPGFVDWLSIGSPASCKNALTVGASRSDRTDGALSQTTWGAAWPNNFPQPPIASQTISGSPESLAAFSSRGPTDDRRIKPDLVAPGTDILSTRSALAPATHFWGIFAGNPKYAFDGGTSMATPIVSGCAALVRQYYVDECQHQPSAALLKATLVNSTTWLTGPDSLAPSAGRPNYHQGHGRVCLRSAIPNSSNPNLQLRFVDDWQDQTKSFARTGDRRRFQFQVPNNTPEIRICMAYTDAPARGLQNNLNLIVQHLQSGQKWLGNANIPDQLILPDPDNNLETVPLEKPAAGTYLVQVFAADLLKAPQDFALVITGADISTLTEI